ncbi:M43 family zinc metalloprotease [Flavivirga spongiicola]|uniref:M43 family zinc metalloprotease n=1 Tax=Flavivirga spongiicola TaxID=421621 RepID=A0ABU7XWY3_9FLAO|nr:M43 family zinc metalloprotease [Flavivirga sp. MEBiC05379]MDO5980272.1 M43 family zinc metalloprotease [Flavivirga sp. MEBiC05379]
MIRNSILIALSSIILFSCSKGDGVEHPEETTETVYTLPVVIHIVHTGQEVGTGYNLSNERIIGQIKTLNDDFRKKEGTLGYNIHPLGADTKIEFKLAEIDPNGDQTDGINRVNLNDIFIDTENDWFFDDLPYYGYWNKQDYINVWVFPFEPNTALGQSSVPKANLPGLIDANPDGTTGIMIATPHFGTSDLVGGSNLGRTFTHEMGHFLGLKHLWGKIENANCLDFDDYCEDTPPVSRRTENCDGLANLSCNGESVLTQNYMDYTDDACMNMFTKNQVTRMRYVLKNSNVRKSLITSSAINRN